jgi:UDP-N-acetylmuramoyl-tripeptide--D-alanyl-D-alanine ligase
MVRFNPEELARWSRGEWIPYPPAEVLGITQDTRALSPGGLYVALEGERFDGHQFLGRAFQLGAAAALVRRDNPYLPESPAYPLLMVDDPADALQAIAAAYRRQVAISSVAVTGSVGKTTVKDLIADLLSARLPTARTRGNFNNAVGVPLSVLGLRRSDEAGVFEVGMNHPGELMPLCQIVLPNWGVITGIGPVHIEFFDSIEGIAFEKSEVLRSLPEDGTAVLNRDCPFFELLAAQAPGPVLTVSLEQEADYQCLESAMGPTGMTALILERRTGERHEIFIPLMGRHHIANAMLAIAVARGHEVAWHDIVDILRRFKSAPMRWERQVVGSVTFINDAYNANPLSMRAAIEAFQAGTGPGRRWLVVGGMLELGRHEEAEHLALGHFLAAQDWAGVITVGELGETLAEGARAAGFRTTALFVCEEAEQAAAVLQERIRPGDQVLMKASRGIRLEDVLQAYRMGGRLPEAVPA